MKRAEVAAKETVSYAKNIFTDDFIPLHRPIFEGNERKYLIECIDSNFCLFGWSKGNRFLRRWSKLILLGPIML